MNDSTRLLGRFAVLFCVLAVLFGLSGCAGVETPAPETPKPRAAAPPPTGLFSQAAPPTTPWNTRISPASQQISSFAALAPAVDRSIAYTARKPAGSVAVDRPGATMTWGQLNQTLVAFRRVLPELDRDPSLLSKYFKWVPLDSDTLLTGYYEPEIEVSRTSHGPYVWPIYRNPGALAKKHSREAIDYHGALRGRGLEIGWAKDHIAVYFLQVQGT